MQALAIRYGMPYFYLELANERLTLEAMRNVLAGQTLRARCLLVVEDAEACFRAEDPAAALADARAGADANNG